MIWKSIRHNFANLARLSGRDSPRHFWPYTLFVLGMVIAAWTVAFAFMIQNMFTRVQGFAKAHPDQVTVISGPGHYSMQVHGNHLELMPDFTGVLSYMSILSIAFILLVAAAVARRLHDSNMPGFVALVPAALLATGFWLMHGFFGQISAGGEPGLGRFGMIFAVNVAYLASLAVLVYLLVRGGAADSNKYGAPPGAL